VYASTLHHLGIYEIVGGTTVYQHASTLHHLGIYEIVGGTTVYQHRNILPLILKIRYFGTPKSEATILATDKKGCRSPRWWWWESTSSSYRWLIISNVYLMLQIILRLTVGKYLY